MCCISSHWRLTMAENCPLSKQTAIFMLSNLAKWKGLKVRKKDQFSSIHLSHGRCLLFMWDMLDSHWGISSLHIWLRSWKTIRTTRRLFWPCQGTLCVDCRPWKLPWNHYSRTHKSSPYQRQSHWLDRHSCHSHSLQAHWTAQQCVHVLQHIWKPLHLTWRHSLNPLAERACAVITSDMQCKWQLSQQSQCFCWFLSYCFWNRLMWSLYLQSKPDHLQDSYLKYALISISLEAWSHQGDQRSHVSFLCLEIDCLHQNETEATLQALGLHEYESTWIDGDEQTMW